MLLLASLLLASVLLALLLLLASLLTPLLLALLLLASLLLVAAYPFMKEVPAWRSRPQGFSGGCSRPHKPQLQTRAGACRIGHRCGHVRLEF